MDWADLPRERCGQAKAHFVRDVIERFVEARWNGPQPIGNGPSRKQRPANGCSNPDLLSEENAVKGQKTSVSIRIMAVLDGAILRSERT
jgi:hypothetical protein